MADIVDQMTERLLRDAGVTTGMRVLDVGCGRGTVTLMAASLVGKHGEVLGIDRDAGATSMARERARSLGLSNVSFAESDISAIVPEYGMFDVVVGRRVLMYLADPIGTMRNLVRALREGGRVVFQEHDSTMVPASIAPLPLHERVNRWIWSTVEREGADVHMGFKLAALLDEAGLSVEHIRAEAVVQTSKIPYDAVTIVRAMLGRIVGQGVATEAEIDIDTLGKRLAEELRSSNATYIGDIVFGVWARTLSRLPEER
jgi:SAM-dependent methyltransferase